MTTVASANARSARRCTCPLKNRTETTRCSRSPASANPSVLTASDVLLTPPFPPDARSDVRGNAADRWLRRYFAFGNAKTVSFNNASQHSLLVLTLVPQGKMRGEHAVILQMD